MKKILAILSSVAMLLSACATSDNAPKKPEFPEMQSVVAEPGTSYEITFTANEPWSIALTPESQPYATLSYPAQSNRPEFQFFGEAGEVTILVNMRDIEPSYARDYVATIEMTIRDYTETVAVYTIPHVPYVINVKGYAPEGMPEVKSTFEKGGHPENGPFASYVNTYTVRYLNPSDAEYGDFVVSHDCDLLYNYVVYAKSSVGGEFEPVTDNSWLSLTEFGYKKEKIRLAMKYSSGVFTEGVGYEAYVNLEDENGDALVSVYFLYDPTAVAPVAPAIELAYPDDAAAKGVTFVGEGTAYTLTLPTPDLLGENNKAASIKITGYAGGGYMTENLKFVESDVSGIYYTALAEGVTTDSLVRENTLSVSAINAEGAEDYTITVVFEWAPEGEEYPEVTPEE
ncbi:MAG: hypothetical protein IKA04_05420 [Alistipes sp.]|nr:hypothetical protein [Alistipes sp.]